MKPSIQALALCAALICAGAQAGDGDLDLDFGLGGVARAGVSDLNFGIAPGSMAMQADGKIVACATRLTSGASGSDFFVARFTADGAPDTGFSFDGHATIDFDAGAGSDACAAIAVQGDGKLVVAGRTGNGGLFDGQFALARLNADGTLDSSFGAGTGKVRIPFSYDSGAVAVMIQPNGRIVAAGTDFDHSTDFNTAIAAARLLPDGTLDTAFNLSGKVRVSLGVPGFTQDRANCLALDTQGRILIGGEATDVAGAHGRIAVARLLGNGALDPDFDADGRAMIDFDFGAGAADAQPIGIFLQRDDRIVITGDADTSGTSTANFDIIAARLLPDGSLDSDFGSGGRTRIGFDLGGSNLDAAIAVTEQPNGRLLLAGLALSATSLYGTVVRLSSNGNLDDQFGSFGKRTYDFGLATPSQQFFAGLALQDNQIIVAGLAHVPDSSNAFDLIVTRMHNDLLFADGFE